VVRRPDKFVFLLAGQVKKMVRERQKWAAFHLICLLLAAGHTHGDHAHRTSSESERTAAHRQKRSFHPDPLPYDPEIDMTSVSCNFLKINFKFLFK